MHGENTFEKAHVSFLPYLNPFEQYKKCLNESTWAMAVTKKQRLHGVYGQRIVIRLLKCLGKAYYNSN